VKGVGCLCFPPRPGEKREILADKRNDYVRLISRQRISPVERALKFQIFEVEKKETKKGEKKQKIN